MAVFETQRFINATVLDPSTVSADVEQHFAPRGYEVNKTRTLAGGLLISLRQGGLFKSVMGLKTALNVEVTPEADGVRIKASVGIFGQQAVPTAITMFVCWPVLIPQIWGMIRQSNLDDEAVAVVEQSVLAHPRAGGNATGGPARQAAGGASGRFCTACGEAATATAKFCPACGEKIA